jgi:hypothetical protein
MAGKITTGLGPNVDAFVSKSPALAQMVAEAKRRWPQDFKIKAGNDSFISYRTITVNRAETPLEQALILAHELGHLLNTRNLILGGKSFREFVGRNANAQISEEAAAVRAEIQVRNELRKNGIKVPPYVVKAILNGQPVQLNLEFVIKDPDQFKSMFPNVITEQTNGDPMWIYWPDYFRSKAMQDLYKGLEPQAPKSNPKRPGSSSSINLQDFPALKVAGGGVGSGLSQFQAWQKQNQINQQRLAQQQAQQQMLEAQHRAQEQQREALRRMQEEAQRRAQEQQREALQRMQEEARRRAQEQQREAQRRAQEEARRRAEREAAERLKQIQEMQRKQQAIQTAGIKRPAIDILRPNYWGPGPRGHIYTIIGGPPEIPRGTGGPVSPNQRTFKR